MPRECQLRSGQIKELTLGGFQVFAERTTIPLGPITLLFGPNSAGKSAISDAMQVLAAFCGLFSPSTEADHSIAQLTTSLLERHWHRTAGSPPELAPEVALGMRVCVDRRRWAGVAITAESDPEGDEERYQPSKPSFLTAVSALGPWLSQGGIADLELQLRVLVADPMNLFGQLNRARGAEYSLDLCADVSLSGVPLLAFDADCLAAINLAHPALGGRIKPDQFELLASRFADRVQIEDGWLRFTALAMLNSAGLSDWGIFAVLDAEYEGAFDDEAKYACWEFVGLFDAIWLCTVKTIQQCAEIVLVPASRTVPTRQELTYLMDEVGSSISDTRLGLRMEGRPEFQELATGGLLAALNHEDALAAPVVRTAKHRLERVNRLLTEHLFREKGYFASTEVHMLSLIDSRLANTQSNAVGNQKKVHGYLVTLLLEDAAGRQFTFEEVGSGLGYVMPVLVAVASGRRAFVQQPELHLHPALQADLADAFIAGLVRPEEPALGRDAPAGQYIVETHSEHLLLRMLRRIRQAGQYDTYLNALDLDREKLVVLYVNPLANGTSKVVHLRIARDGEFIDRWPRGFFEERWRELFDE